PNFSTVYVERHQAAVQGIDPFHFLDRVDGRPGDAWQCGVRKDEVCRAPLRDPDIARQVVNERVGLAADALVEAVNDYDEDDPECDAADRHEQFYFVRKQVPAGDRNHNPSIRWWPPARD